MSITAETAKQHAHDPAVLCCRAEAGITIGTGDSWRTQVSLTSW